MYEYMTEIPPLELFQGPFTSSLNQPLLSICAPDPKLEKVGFKNIIWGHLGGSIS